MTLSDDQAVLFDLDAVLTSTTAPHGACWKAALDEGHGLMLRYVDELGRLAPGAPVARPVAGLARRHGPAA